MAKIIPSIEQCLKSKQAPTEGELFLLNYLAENFDSEATVYFQPCINGLRPDIVIVKENTGAIIIEVKDWDLNSYYIDGDNNWNLTHKKVKLKSPQAQAFDYKKNIFDIQSRLLSERGTKSSYFYDTISVFAYLHNATLYQVKDFYAEPLRLNKEESNKINETYKSYTEQEKTRNQKWYSGKLDYLKTKKRQLERDEKLIITQQSLSKLKFSNKKTELFDTKVYDEITRLLNPPLHYANEGSEINYTPRQLKLSESNENSRMKIGGVAGSGKTSVLAKRAVNAFIRHNDSVLILTFNLTLISYIKGKINEVRNDFPWSIFEIKNYHLFFREKLNEIGLPEVEHSYGFKHAESHYYSNINIFDGYQINRKYKTIFIDEAQDYKKEWLTILKNYFLEDDGEMVLFGDEKQNIYQRELDKERRSSLIQGFGAWQDLKKSFRYTKNSPVIDLSKRFQTEFLLKKYNQDEDETLFQASLDFSNITGVYIYDNSHPDYLKNIADFIFQTAKNNIIHPNDITVLSSEKEKIADIDYYLRTEPHLQQRTLTTFVGKELLEKPNYKKDEIKLERAKKIGFNLNSGVTKLSTVHSFKGFESPYVFLIINDKDTAEIIYTGITRAKDAAIILINKNNTEYLEFFKENLKTIN